MSASFSLKQSVIELSNAQVASQALHRRPGVPSTQLVNVQGDPDFRGTKPRSLTLAAIAFRQTLWLLQPIDYCNSN